ncbi:ribosome maturation factor RimM [Bartonella krasnovii]|uniref:Ribosome maturation factor RimM n=1 Tax=Bartonella krasnovii TaxID=2267275 RepID=A0A5B9D3H0_9HYPH|nr:ribosome maturation factor RimM [Bartonella krasnovii]QEE12910.1 ribosome maturation factor RimM [Bartonella krasnovii]UNF37005.1 ribosome maturation factor RimM [Bartonella krasnovii]UNF38704.1 ribosome maturation factor RimM [Bartonella krasnovii]UNF42092.1 ribosome maturation factor RimM [Bartonella krasnovii]UNF46937.1 ribosome maturation factor RimM [Bartonella krasnovii]
MKYNKEKLKNKVYLAIIGVPHGIRGDVFVKILSAEPQRFKSYRTLYDDMGRSYEIVTLRTQKNNAIVRFKGIDNRNDAESLKGIRLYVMRNQLIDDLDEDEFYQVDLIGLRVQEYGGKILGEVCGFYNFGAGDLLEIGLNTGKRVLIPFSKVAVPEICMDSGFLIVDPMAAGLSDGRENDQ